VPEGHKAEFSTGTILPLILFHKSSPPRWKIEIKLDVIFASDVIILYFKFIGFSLHAAIIFYATQTGRRLCHCGSPIGLSLSLFLQIKV